MPAQKRKLNQAQIAGMAAGRDRARRQRLDLRIRKVDERRAGFTDLPPELRLEIYGKLLTPDDGSAISINNALVRFYKPDRPHKPKLNGNRLCLDLLQVCKAVNYEAEHYFYHENVFRIECLSLGYKHHWTMDIIRPKAPLEEWDDNPERRKSDLRSDIAHPGLATGLEHISPTALASMRKLEFAYHDDLKEHYPWTFPRNRTFLQFSQKARVVVRLDVLRFKPWYYLEINTDHSTETDQKWKKEFRERFKRDLQADLLTRGAVSLVKPRLFDLAYCVVNIGDRLSRKEQPLSARSARHVEGPGWLL